MQPQQAAWMQWLTEMLGVDPRAGVWGLIGAFLSLRFTPKLGVFQLWTTLIGGAACASLFGPMVSKAWPLWSPSGAGFLIGLLAMSAIGGVMVLANDFKSDPQAFFERWLPWIKRKPGGEA